MSNPIPIPIPTPSPARRLARPLACALLTLLFAAGLARAADSSSPVKPTLYLVGDSTVKNGSGKGQGGLWGWGDQIAPLFDTTKINVVNRALGGRSSRTYITEGLWQKVADQLKPGDFVLMQFGHNDGGSSYNTGSRPRSSIKGNGEESKEIVWEATGKKEVVHTYGWYLRQIVADAKAKGATAIVLSQIPRNMWKDGKVLRASADYGKWAAEAAQQSGAPFIDLNKITADELDKMGEAKVKPLFGATDHTHTTLEGAKLNAASVVAGIRQLQDCPLAGYLKP